MRNAESKLLDQLDWDKMDGLLPVVVQDASTRQVLMLGYMNREAFKMTCETQEVTFYSRSKKRLWKKGEVSGNSLTLVRCSTDCDKDALLILAKPKGYTCHLNTRSCFNDDDALGVGLLSKLETMIEERQTERPANSYVTSLFEEGLRRIAQKVGEEGLELALASVSGTKKDIIDEAADLLFHFLVLLKECQLDLFDVLQELQQRTNKE
jgi:phosphoribosyl-ATP pyrophosphohydrolase/phosphoribosyl-AMP cyclohydrolase